MSGSLKLPVRFWRSVPSRIPVGHVEETWDIDLKRVCFVSLHAWNVGCPGGPDVPEDFWVDMGSPQNHDVGWQIIEEAIVPALDAARSSGLTVVHVQPETIADKYPERQPPRTDLEHHQAQEIPGLIRKSRPPISSHANDRAQRVHGEGFGNWDGWKDLDFALPLMPVGDEPILVADDQWDDWLRERGIDTLVYVGFCTNLCILDAPGGMRRMAPRGYRCILLRDATMGVEFPDTLEDRTHTKAALRYIETWVGYTASTSEFIAACAALGNS